MAQRGTSWVATGAIRGADSLARRSHAPDVPGCGRDRDEVIAAAELPAAGSAMTRECRYVKSMAALLRGAIAAARGVDAMRLRDLVSSGIFLLVAVGHFAAQWYGWKQHLAGMQSVPVTGDPSGWWHTCSFPLFVLVPGRYHHLHFFALLVANSVVWGLAGAWLAHMLQRRRRPRRRGQRLGTLHPKAPAARTTTDRILELKRRRDQGEISAEEYQRQRASITSGA